MNEIMKRMWPDHDVKQILELIRTSIYLKKNPLK